MECNGIRDLPPGFRPIGFRLAIAHPSAMRRGFDSLPRDDPNGTKEAPKIVSEHYAVNDVEQESGEHWPNTQCEPEHAHSRQRHQKDHHQQPGDQGELYSPNHLTSAPEVIGQRKQATPQNRTNQ